MIRGSPRNEVINLIVALGETYVSPPSPPFLSYLHLGGDTDGDSAIHQRLCELLSESAVGPVLRSVEGDQCRQDIYQRYLEDFVRSTHQCNYTDPNCTEMEYKVQ